MEKVDVLLPPAFKPSGVIKSRQSAITDGDWIGTFNLWILQSDPIPSIIYQQRSPNSTWEPNKLDVSVGGHYQAGEKWVMDSERQKKNWAVNMIHHN